MPICSTLREVERSYVRFDPTNVQHLEAFRRLCLGEQGSTSNIKQHETLRFELEGNFTDVRTMMFHKVGQHHFEQTLKRKAARKVKKAEVAA